MKFWVILFCLLALYRADNSTPDPNDPNDEEDTEVHLTCINDQNQRGEMHTGDTEYQNQADCGKFSVCKYCAKWHGKNKDGTDLSYWGCGCGTDNNLPFLMMGENCTKKGRIHNIRDSIHGNSELKGTMICCEGQKCNSANEMSTLLTKALLFAILMLEFSP